MLGVTLRWTSIPSKESKNTTSSFIPDGPLGSYVDFKFFLPPPPKQVNIGSEYVTKTDKFPAVWRIILGLFSGVAKEV